MECKNVKTGKCIYILSSDEGAEYMNNESPCPHCLDFLDIDRDSILYPYKLYKYFNKVYGQEKFNLLAMFEDCKEIKERLLCFNALMKVKGKILNFSGGDYNGIAIPLDIFPVKYTLDEEKSFEVFGVFADDILLLKKYLKDSFLSDIELTEKITQQDIRNSLNKFSYKHLGMIQVSKKQLESIEELIYHYEEENKEESIEEALEDLNSEFYNKIKEDEDEQ